MLASELENRLKKYHRYYISYCRAYNEIQWELEEIRLLLLTAEHSNYNKLKLNESLYRYAETSINTLFWIFGKVGKDGPTFPFVHCFLREWRNECHHVGMIDFELYDIAFDVNGKKHNYKMNYYVYPMLNKIENINKKIVNYFGDKHIGTDATVAGLLKYHHDYMLKVFSDKRNETNSEMPNRMNIGQDELGAFFGPSHKKYIPNDEFWTKGLDNS